MNELIVIKGWDEDVKRGEEKRREGKGRGKVEVLRITLALTLENIGKSQCCRMARDGMKSRADLHTCVQDAPATRPLTVGHGHGFAKVHPITNLMMDAVLRL